MPARLALLASMLLAPAATAGNWPQWRGPQNDGVSPETSLPATWSATENVLLKIPMPGPGASTPCIWGDRIFMTAQVGEKLNLFCVGTDGKSLWTRTMGTGEGKYRGDEGNMASASCSTDGKLVYAFVGTGTLGAYDFDGKPAWEIDCQAKFGKFRIQFGGHWTPVLYKDRLYVTLLHRDIQLILALDKATGEVAWKTERPSDSVGESPDVYASPFVWHKGDEAMLIVHGNDYCTGHSLKDGHEVWRVNELNPKKNYNRTWRAVSSPLVTPDLIVIPSCKQHPTVAIDPTKAKGLIAPGNTAEDWRYKTTPDVPSPLLVNGIVYLMGATGQIAALEAKTGKEIFNQRVTNERHRACPVVADGKVYLLGREGTCPVITAGTKAFDELAKNKLPDTFTASPAVSGGRIYLRGWKTLWVVGTK
jgi:outer membrane protein assembly factor BamB